MGKVERTKTKSPLSKQTGWILVILFVVLVFLLKGGPSVYIGLGRVLVPLLILYLIYRYVSGIMRRTKDAFESQLHNQTKDEEAMIILCPKCGAHPKRGRCQEPKCPIRGPVRG